MVRTEPSEGSNPVGRASGGGRDAAVTDMRATAFPRASTDSAEKLPKAVNRMDMRKETIAQPPRV